MNLILLLLLLLLFLCTSSFSSSSLFTSATITRRIENGKPIINFGCGDVIENNFDPSDADAEISCGDQLAKPNLTNTSDRSLFIYPTRPCHVIIRNTRAKYFACHDSFLLSSITVVNSHFSHFASYASFDFTTASENFILVNNVTIHNRGSSTHSALQFSSPFAYFPEKPLEGVQGYYVKHYSINEVPTLRSVLSNITITNVHCERDVVEGSTDNFIFISGINEVRGDILFENISFGLTKEEVVEYHYHNQNNNNNNQPDETRKRNQLAYLQQLALQESRNSPAAFAQMTPEETSIYEGSVIFRNLTGIFSELVQSYDDKTLVVNRGLRMWRTGLVKGSIILENLNFAFVSGAKPRQNLLMEISHVLGGVSQDIVYRDCSFFMGRKSSPSSGAITNYHDMYIQFCAYFNTVNSLGGSFTVTRNLCVIDGFFVAGEGLYVSGVQNMVSRNLDTNRLNSFSITKNTIEISLTDPEHFIQLRGISLGEPGQQLMKNITSVFIGENTIIGRGRRSSQVYFPEKVADLATKFNAGIFILHVLGVLVDNAHDIFDPLLDSSSSSSSSSDISGSGSIVIRNNTIDLTVKIDTNQITSVIAAAENSGGAPFQKVREIHFVHNNVTMRGWSNTFIGLRMAQDRLPGLQLLNFSNNVINLQNAELIACKVMELPMVKVTMGLLKSFGQSMLLLLSTSFPYITGAEIFAPSQAFIARDNNIILFVDPRTVQDSSSFSSSSSSSFDVAGFLPPSEYQNKLAESATRLSSIAAFSLRDTSNASNLREIIISRNKFMMLKPTVESRKQQFRDRDISTVPRQQNSHVTFLHYGPGNSINNTNSFIEKLVLERNVMNVATTSQANFLWLENVPMKVSSSSSENAPGLKLMANKIKISIANEGKSDSTSSSAAFVENFLLLKGYSSSAIGFGEELLWGMNPIISRRNLETSGKVGEIELIRISNAENIIHENDDNAGDSFILNDGVLVGNEFAVTRDANEEAAVKISCSMLRLNLTVSNDIGDKIEEFRAQGALQNDEKNNKVRIVRKFKADSVANAAASWLSLDGCQSQSIISLETPRRLTSVLIPPGSNSNNNQQQPATNIRIDVSDNQLSSSSALAASSIVDFDHSVFSDADVHRSAANTQIQVNVARNRITTTSSGNTSSLASISELSGADSSIGSSSSSSAPSQRTRLKLDFVENSLVVDDQQHLHSKPPPYSVLRRQSSSTNRVGVSLFSSTAATFPFLAINISRSHNEEREEGLCNLVNGRDIEMRDAERDFSALFEDYSVSSSSAVSSSAITATGCVTTRTLSATFWNESGHKQRRRTTTPMQLQRPRPPAVVSRGVQTASNAMQGVAMVAAGISSAAAVPTVAFSVARQQAMFGFIRRLTGGNCAFDSSTLAERRAESGNDDEEQDEFETVDAAESPTQMALGDATMNPARHFVGAVVGNFVLSCCLVLGGQAAGTLFLWRSGSRSWRDPLSVFARCNVSLVVFVCASLLFAPTLTYGLVVAAMSGRTVPQGSKILAVVVSLLLFALPCSYYVVWALWLRRSRVVPPPKSRSPKTSSEENRKHVRERYVRRYDVSQRRSASKEKAAGCMALLKRVYAYWLEGPGEWAMPSSNTSSSSSRLRDDDRRDRMDFDIAVPVFDGFNLRAKWFAVAEFGVQALLALTAFVVQLLEDRGPEVNCVANLVLLLVIDGVYLVLCLWLRPFQELFLRIATPLLVALQMVVVIVTYLLKDRLLAASSTDNNNNNNDDSNYVVTSEAMVVQVMLVVTMVMQTMMSLLVLVASVAPILRIARRVLARISDKAVDSVQSSSSASPMITRRQRSATLRDLILSQDEEIKRDQSLLSPTASPPTAMQRNNHHRPRSSPSHTVRPRSSSESRGHPDRRSHDSQHHHRNSSSRRRDETHNDHHRHRAQNRNSLPSSSPSSRIHHSLASSRNHYSSSHRHDEDGDNHHHRRRNSSSRHHERSSSGQLRPSLSSTAATMNRPPGLSRNNNNTKTSSVSRSRPSRSNFAEL